MGRGVALLILSLFAITLSKEEDAASAENKVSDFVAQVKAAFEQINDWQRRTETILAQFALGSLPENFTPELFAPSDGSINATVSLNLQRTAFRSLVYRRMMTSVHPSLKVAIPKYLALSEAEAVEHELKHNGFPAFIIDGELFISKHAFQNQ